MKKNKLFMLLLIFTLLTMFTQKVEAAPNVTEDGISITNIGSTTALVDWSGTVEVYRAKGYNLSGVYKVTWWSVNTGDTTIVDGSTQTSAYLTGLPSGTRCCIEVRPYYYSDNINDGSWGYNVAWFETDGSTSTITPTPSPVPTPAPNVPQGPTTPAPSSIVLSTPSVSKAVIVGDRLEVLANNIDPNARKLEWQVIDVKNGNKVVNTDVSYTTGNIFYNLSRKIYAIQCRAVAYDSNYNDVYSAWSTQKYVISQPKVSTNKKYLKKNSITVSFKKIKGAKDYTIYMRKKGSSKWTKVKTTKKNKYKITKFKGKSINLVNKTYEFCVIANAKVGKKTIKSAKKEYIYTRIYYR